MLNSHKKHPLAEKIEEERYNILMRELVAHLIGGFFGAALLYFIFKSQVSEENLLLWLQVNAVLLVISVLGFGFYYLRPQTFQTTTWSGLITLALLIWGCGWGTAPWIFLQNPDPVYIVTLIALLIGVCTSPSITLSLYPASYFCFITPILASLAWHLSLIDFGQSLLIKLLIPILWLFLLGYAYNLHKLLINNICLRVENEYQLHEARQANLSKSRFLAAASHDIRQPLQAINLFLSAIEADSKTPQNAQLFERLQSSVNSMSELLNHLLDISKLDAQALETHIKHIPLAPLLEKLRNEFEPQANRKGLAFELDSLECAVISDPVLLERTLSNLLSNAVRYTQEGQVRLDCQMIDECIEIMVSDSGPGIPLEAQERVFEEFHQLDNSTRDRQQGLGLGLSIVKRLCELLDHPLILTSIQGEGTCFALQLPIGNLNQSDTSTRSTPRPWDISGCKLLVIDDEEAIRVGLEKLLEKWGCEAVSAASANEALQQLSDWEPDIIISDYSLGDDHTGTEAIKQITEALGREVPAMLITGDTAADRITEARASGHMLLHKPVKPGQLRTAIQRLRHLAATKPNRSA